MDKELRFSKNFSSYHLLKNQPTKCHIILIANDVTILRNLVPHYHN